VTNLCPLCKQEFKEIKKKNKDNDNENLIIKIKRRKQRSDHYDEEPDEYDNSLIFLIFY